MKKLAIIIVCLLAVVGLAQLLMPALIWDGATRAEIEVLALDSGTGNGIPDVKVSLIYRRIPKMQVVTDASGRAQLREMFPASGSSTLLYRTTTLSTRAYSLRLEKNGFTTSEIPLAADGRVRGKRIRCRVELQRVGGGG